MLSLFVSLALAAEPPVCKIKVSPGSVVAGKPVTLTASLKQKPAAPIYTWVTTGGRLAGSGPATTLDTTGLVPGRYLVMLEVASAGVSAGSCSAHVTVKGAK